MKLPVTVGTAVIFGASLFGQAPPGPLPPPQSGQAQSQVSTPNRGPHVSGRFGDLAITVMRLSVAPGEPDRSELTVSVTAVNTGREAVCANLIATLHTSYDLSYQGESVYAPRMREMLPGEINTGYYVFHTRKGVKPLEIVFRNPFHSIRCGTYAMDALLPEEIRLDISGIPVATPQRSASGLPRKAVQHANGSRSINGATTATSDTSAAALGSVGILAVVLIALAAALVAAVVYFTPTIVAYRKQKANRGAILAVNVLLGWTFLGWVVAMVWALKVDVVDLR